MATTYTNNMGLAKPAVADRGWDAPINANVDALDATTAIGSLRAQANEQPSASLTIKVSAGRYALADGSIAVFAGGTIVCDASTSVCVWLTTAGALAKGAAFPTTPHIPICVAATGATYISAIIDAAVLHRVVGV